MLQVIRGSIFECFPEVGIAKPYPLGIFLLLPLPRCLAGLTIPKTMLRVTASTAGQTKRYYNESLTKEGYYSEGGEIAGHWGGKGAARLGLSGRVDKEAFIALCDNTNPATGEKLTPRTKENRRVSYDFNFNVPKSVSLAYEYHQDERIFGAFVDCVRATMVDLEQEIATRVRKGGQDCDRPTGAMLWAEFFHFWARPEGGVPDPHLHGHVVAFNATPDPVEGCWKAAQMGGVLENINFYQASFHTRFARRLRALGYETIAQGISFELAGVSRSLIEKFSRRGATIEGQGQRAWDHQGGGKGQARRPDPRKEGPGPL